MAAQTHGAALAQKGPDSCLLQWLLAQYVQSASEKKYQTKRLCGQKQLQQHQVLQSSSMCWC